MAPSLPFPVRVTAGAVVAGFEQLRRLPEDLPSMSVTLAGQAMRASMRLRQEITELATRGDEFLSPFIDPPEEKPAWAHFDDEDEEEDEAPASGDEAADTFEPVADVAEETPQMPGYDDLRLAQVRARMVRLTSEEIAGLLEHERASQQRASFMTMLENRITTLASQRADTARGKRTRGR